MKKIIACAVFFTAIVASAAVQAVRVGEWALDGMCHIKNHDPKNWSLYTKALPSKTKGVSYVHIRLESEKPAKRPLLTAKMRLPGGEARALWRPETGCRKFERAGFLPFSSHASFASCCAQWMPLYAFLDAEDNNILTLASSESRDRVVFRGGTEEGPNNLKIEFSFNTMDCETLTNRFEITLRFDARRLSADRTLPDAAAWMRASDPKAERPIPQLAFEPVWSSWCAYHHSITESIVEREAEIARSVGLNTIIVDDGWQVPAGIIPCLGENLPTLRYTKDFAAHVARLHAAGTKIVLWFPVPLFTESAPNFASYNGHALYRRTWGPYVWDPRFPERRKFYFDRLSTAMRDWKVDGLKLDFIDSWGLDFDSWKLPDVSKGLGSRDFRDLMPAVEETVTKARKIISDIRPDAVIEFRQGYIGPHMLKACTQVRVHDCPGSLAEMRYGIANLRLTSGPNAVHSDPIHWAYNAPAHSVAESILASIFGIGQYSVRLMDASPEVLAILKHWVAFTREHSTALYRGDFRVQGLSSDAPVLVGESPKERIVGVYKPNFVADCGTPDKRIIILNGTGTERVTVRFTKETKAIAYGLDGKQIKEIAIPQGLSEIALPRGGYLISL